MARIYAKWTCPYCGEKIGANNFKRHCRTHSEHSTTSDNYESGIIQQTLNIPQITTSDYYVVHNTGSDSIFCDDRPLEVFAFHLSGFVNITDKYILLYYTTFDGVNCVTRFDTNEVFISWAYDKVYISETAIKSRWDSDLEKTFQKFGRLYRSVYGNAFYGRYTITRDRWEHREQTRKVV